MTRMMYAFIAIHIDIDPDATRRMIRVAWDVVALLDAEVERELLFWKWLLPQHKWASIRLLTPTPSVVIGFDAGDFAFGGWLDDSNGRRLLTRELFLQCEQAWSSTARKLTTVLRGLLALAHRLKELLKTQLAGPLVILLIGNNQSVCLALEIDSRTPKIHRVVAAIFRMTWANQILLLPRWLRRDRRASVLSDDISKWAGLCDFMLLPDIFSRIQRELGCVHTVDRFATITNR
jgi:hypothetical protein